MKIDKISKNYKNSAFIGKYTLNNLNKEYLKINGKQLRDDFVHIINAPQNLLGEGKEKTVFSVPNITNYVIAILKGQFNPNIGFCEVKPIKDQLPKFNFGQCIAEGNNGLQILRRINGEPHLIPNWFQRVLSYIINNDITKQDALIALEKLKQLEKFPQESFDVLVQKVKYLNRKNAR